MPISSKGFTRTSFILLLVGLAALLAIIATTLGLVERNQVFLDEVIEARLAHRAAVDLRSHIQQAETGQRGYLLTLDETYLEPYTAAVGRVGPVFEELREVLRLYPQAEEPLAGMERDLAIKLAEMDRTIALAQSGDLDGAIAIVRTDEGEAAMENIRFLIDALIEAADERTIAGVQNQHGAVAALRWTALLGGLIIVGVIGGAAYLVARYTRDIDRARAEVEGLNADLEGRVAERTEDLMRANEEVQRFAYIVTHDLRAPLVNIMGFTSELDASLPPIRALIEREDQQSEDPVVAEARQAALEDLPESITFIRSSTKKMDGLINAILKISREGKRDLRAERLDIAEVVETASNAVRHQITDNDGEVTIGVETPPIYTDRMTLDQILGNLLDNAVKYRSPDRPLRIAITARQERSGRVVLSIKDNGRGIAPEDHERVFELFRRSGSQDQAGEGIGLAHVRIMARNLGGDIALRSDFGAGTEFIVTLAPDLRAIKRRAA